MSTVTTSSNKRLSKYDFQPAKNASTPTANYVINPKGAVCPGMLSKNIPRKSSHHTASLRLQQKEFSKPSIKSSKSNNVVSQVVTSSTSEAQTPISISSTQGIFEIHLKHLEMSDTGLKNIESICGDKLTSLRLSWKFLTFERSIVNITNCTGQVVQIEYAVLYKIDMNDNFFEYIFTRHLSLELYGRVGSKESYLARGELSLTDSIEYPLNELYCNVDLCDIDKALLLSNTGIAVVYGTLTLWYRLSCDTEILGPYVNREGHIYYSPSTADTQSKQKNERQRRSSLMQILKSDPRQQSLSSRRTSLVFMSQSDLSEDSESISSLEPTESEIAGFQEALDLVLSRNKALRITQLEITNELRDRAKWLHEESSWKRTLQEHYILSGKDPDEVQWRQWRTPSTANVKLRNYKSQVAIYAPEVVITVEYIKFYKNSAPVKNNKFKNLYVEYAFLTHDGIEMEFPTTVPLSTEGKKMVFNFTKRFSLKLEENSEDCYKLAEVVKNSEDVVFSVIGEPENDSTEVPCCEEITSTSINMLELMEIESNELNASLPLCDPKDETDEIGYMKIRIDGVQAMRRLALKLLAPIGFNLLESP